MISSNFVEIPGLRMHYLQKGTGEPVVLLHGFPQTSHQWRHQIETLGEHYAVFAPDNRGFGRTDKPRIRVNRGMLARDTVRFMDALGIQQATVVGHDWGGIIAFKVVADFPRRVARVALLDTLCTVWSPRAIHGYWFKAEGLAEDFFARHHRAFIEVLFGGRDGDDLPKPPTAPWVLPAGARQRPDWIDGQSLNHYIESFSDPDSHFAAIQYYRYALAFHRVTEDPDAPNGERCDLLSEAEVAAMWLHKDGLRNHPLYVHYMDYGPEDRRTRYEGPALWMYGAYLGRAGSVRHGDDTVPSGNRFVEQFPRYFPDLRVRAVGVGHFLGEEAPDYVNETLLSFLGGRL